MLQNHGYLKWHVPTGSSTLVGLFRSVIYVSACQSKFYVASLSLPYEDLCRTHQVEVPNKYGFCTLRIRNGQLLDENIKVPENARVRILVFVSSCKRPHGIPLHIYCFSLPPSGSPLFCFISPLPLSLSIVACSLLALNSATRSASSSRIRRSPTFWEFWQNSRDESGALFLSLFSFLIFSVLISFFLLLHFDLVLLFSI